MSQTPVRVLIVGCGAVTGEYYVPALQRLTKDGSVAVTAVVDRDTTRAQDTGRRLGVKYFDDVAAALSRTDAALAIVASPPALHVEHVTAVLRSGLHAFCEKPLTTSSGQCESMLSVAAETGRRVFVGLPRRFYPAAQDIAAMVRDGRLGSTVNFVYREGSRFDWPLASSAAYQRARAGGGVLIDRGSHILDMFIGIFGGPQRVEYFDDAFAKGVETNSLIRWHGDHINGSIALSWDQELANGLHISGDAGTLSWNPSTIDRFAWRPVGGTAQPVISKAAWPSSVQQHKHSQQTPRSYEECIVLELATALRAVVRDEPSALDGATALPTIRLIDHCYEHARPLEQPWLTSAEQGVACQRHWTQA